ncbi:leucyl aminopeptidase family protein [Sphingorhabdus arenilitoris]|uniref:Leucyl aminopeptidase family protein n=1 Tax=Sphingorhabdus arenilitoris TaxID=1490041 RepID=A0ABV8RFC2_9SPHN
MTDYHKLIAPDTGQDAKSILVVQTSNFGEWLTAQSDRIRGMVAAHKFTGGAGELAILSGENAGDWSILIGAADISKLDVWALAKAAESLPAGCYRLQGAEAGDAMLGWILGQYSFDEYRDASQREGARILLVQEPGRIDTVVAQAQATAFVRDLVNRPAGDLGPEQLEAETLKIAKKHKAKVQVTSGDALESGYPMIHAVGRAAARGFGPRLIEAHWGDERHPRIAVIGKGITFDSGGLNMKSGAGMRIMKKDMGGAAHALALADLIMAAHLPVRLHLLIAAAENCVSGNALRPGDIVKSRSGITVEIDNTDAEGRLVLSDAFTKAGEDTPELMIDFATLTGAARVALGPDLPAMFTNDDALAEAIHDAGNLVSDPNWRLPLWDDYADMLASDVADTANSGGSFAGSVTAALFLKKFVPENTRWVHFDTYAWRPAAKPGRPKGGEALGLRAVFGYLAKTYPAR